MADLNIFFSCKSGKNFFRNKWVVLICACTVLGIDCGFFLSFGVLFVDLLEEYKESRTHVAAVPTSHNTIGLCSGFFIGFVVDKYSPRTCGVIGCLLNAIAVALSYFAKGTTFLIISLGIVGGISNRLFLISGLRIISFIFERSATPMALSIYTTSTSVAGVPYPYFLRYLSNTYGLQWTFVITGAFMSTSVLLATTWTVPRPTITLEALSNVGTSCDNEEPFNSMLPFTESRNQASGGTKRKVSSDTEGGIINDEKCLDILKTLLSNPSFVFFTVGQAFTHGAFRSLGFFITDI